MGRTSIVWSPAEDSKLTRWTKEGVPVKEIAARLDRTYHQVTQRRAWLRDRGKLKRHHLGGPNNHPWTLAEELELRTMIQDGKSTKAIAKALNRSHNAVRIRCTRLGIRRRKDRQVLTCRQVADKMGLGCAKTVTRWIQEGWLKGRRMSRCCDGRAWAWVIDELDLWAMLENPQTFMAWHPDRITDPELQAHGREHWRKVWLTPSETARKLGICTSHVKILHAKGELIGYRYGNWWYDVGGLEHFVLPCERPRRQTRPRRVMGECRERSTVMYDCCSRMMPLELLFEDDRRSHICDRCRPHYHALPGGHLVRLQPIDAYPKHQGFWRNAWRPDVESDVDGEGVRHG